MMGRVSWRFWPLVAKGMIGLVATTAIAVGSADINPWLGWQSQRAIAQSIRPDDVWQQVYEKLPDFPLENQYIDKESGKTATTNTLVGRLIRYHLYTRGRQPFYRLDWKITLAEYLGVYGVLNEDDYPGRSKLKKNPVDGDVAVIRSLNRVQRDALIQALVTAFSPQKQPAKPTPKPFIKLPTP